MGGLGWSYDQYPERHSNSPYPANDLGKPFGFAFTLDVFERDKTQRIQLDVP